VSKSFLAMVRFPEDVRHERRPAGSGSDEPSNRLRPLVSRDLGRPFRV
jgi:hypothetical protein